ncbi:hypothetical protein [Anaerotignum sp.]|uniref:hypothetical protein n=1 Tax=Anaerotignum sp. TaxID=2039241 RepID=UPI00289BB7FD|nr:hypothetical protein [Anaerotignum sp.]
MLKEIKRQFKNLSAKKVIVISKIIFGVVALILILLSHSLDFAINLGSLAIQVLQSAL